MNGKVRAAMPGRSEPAAALTAVVEDLAGELSLRPLLERILKRSTELLGCDAGSICLVDEAAGVYRKEADIGIACQSGKVFPLTEGTTGAVVARRGPVIFEDYGDVPGGHVRPEDREALKGVIGVPIWWRGAIVGSLVVFTRDPSRAFVHEDAELLELFAKHAAIAITNARLHEAAESNARAEAAAAERNRMAREVHDAFAQGTRVGVAAAPSGPGSDRRRQARRSDRRARRGPDGGRSRLRGDEAQRARTGALTAGRPFARRGARARARLGEPDGCDRRPPRDGGQPGGSLARRCPHVVPDRPGGAHQRDPPRPGRVGSGRAGVLAHGRHPARAGRRRRIRPEPRSKRMESSMASGSVGWPSGPACWAGRWSSIRHPDGVPGSAPGSPRPPRFRTRSAERPIPSGSSWSTTMR